MMKYIKVIVSVLLMSIVAYAGSGLSSFCTCSDNCVATAEVQNKPCCCCSDTPRSEQPSSCGTDCCNEHVSVDWISSVQNVQTYLIPSFCLLFHDVESPLLNISDSLLKQSQTLISTKSQQPPNIHKSEYLSLLTILII